METVIDGTPYRAQRGFFEMTERDAVAHLQSAGYGKSWQIGGVPAPGSGRRCTNCGFASWFVRCSRCETDTCERT